MSAIAIDSLLLWKRNPAQMVRDVFGVEPDLWQVDVLNAFPHNQRVALLASKGVGKAQPKNLMLYTPKGLTRWGDLQAGDYVFAPDGKPTKILSTHEQGIVDTYRVYFDDDSFTDCCGDHLWRVRGAMERARKIFKEGNRESGWITISTKDIIKRGVRNKNGRWAGRQFEIPRHKAVEFEYQELPLDAYMMGVWLSDGSANRGQFTNDALEIDAELIRREFIINRKNDGHGKNINIYVKGLSAKLKEIGIYTINSHNRYIPEIYKTASIQQRKDLLTGLMDTDGCVGKDNGSMEYATTSKKLAKDVVWLVRSLGGAAYIKNGIKKPFYYGKNREKIHGKDCYRVTVRTDFCPFFMKKKVERWIPANNKSKERYLTRYIDRIEKIEPQNSMCITVEHESNCYLTNDFIVTHNTALMSWIIWNFLLTRTNPKIAALSISAENLADNLWAELAYWQNKSPMLKALFTWTKTRIYCNTAPETWFCSARTYAKSANAQEQANALAGLHADNIMFVLDESGSMSNALMATAEAALSSCKEGHILQAGNPTHLDGCLYSAATKERHLWFVQEINSDPDNPKRSPRVSIEWAKQQIDKYGRDNPYVLINVFGKFPPSSLNSLISLDEVRDSTERNYNNFATDACILGVDVALSGDDSSVIARRQGLQMFNFQQYRNINGTQGAGQVARIWNEYKADACFIDNTGGFGSSWVDNLLRLGYAPIGVHFSEKSNNPRYFNKRTEMMFEFVEWIKRGGAIPDVPELTAALTTTTYSFKGDKVIIEPKELIKDRLGYSPDHMDSAILTFAHPVIKQTCREQKEIMGIQSGAHTYKYDEFYG